jgi:ubiquinone/menaquinone biosynthesis C-methylase UbiE
MPEDYMTRKMKNTKGEYHAYDKVNKDFYDMQTDRKKVGWFRAWYHTSRFERTTSLVEKYMKKNGVILDLACGNCVWNYKKIKVVGFDINEKMLDYALKKKRIIKKIVGNVYDTKIRSNSVDMVILSEVLEHLENYDAAIKEIRRILRRGGVFILSVPYDSFYTPFFWLFKVQCFVQGTLKGNEYYKNDCGHINHFSKKDIQKLLKNNRFSVKELFLHNTFIIFAVSVKR